MYDISHDFALILILILLTDCVQPFERVTNGYKLSHISEIIFDKRCSSHVTFHVDYSEVGNSQYILEQLRIVSGTAKTTKDLPKSFAY